MPQGLAVGSLREPLLEQLRLDSELLQVLRQCFALRLTALSPLVHLHKPLFFPVLTQNCSPSPPSHPALLFRPSQDHGLMDYSLIVRIRSTSQLMERPDALGLEGASQTPYLCGAGEFVANLPRISSDIDEDAREGGTKVLYMMGIVDLLQR